MSKNQQEWTRKERISITATATGHVKPTHAQQEQVYQLLALNKKGR